MRRIIAVLILLLTLSTACCGAVSEDMSVYVRKDVFEVYMQNINMNMERILNKLDNLEKIVNENTSAISALSARIDGVESSLSAQIKGTNVRIDDLRNGMYLWLVVIGTIISAILAWPKVKEVIQTRSAGRKYTTLEDVMLLIEENNAKLGRSSQG